MEKELKIKLAIAKARNIVYYRSIDERPRAQYLHVLREYRDQLLDLVLDPDPSPEIDLLRRILSVLPVKVKSSDTDIVIQNIETTMEEWRQCQ